MIWYLVLGLFAALTVFHVVVRYGYKGRLVSNIPAVYPTLPIIGSLLVFIGKNQLTSWDMYRNFHKKYYPIVKLWSLTFPTMLIWDPDDIKAVLTSKDNLDKALPYSFIEFAAGTGLITGGGEKATRRRKLLSPAFHIDILKKYIDVTNDHMKAFIEKMSKSDDNCVQNFSELSSRLILTIVSETSMGVKKEFFEKRTGYYESLVKGTFQIAAYRHLRPYLPTWLFQFTTVGRKQNVLGKEINGFAKKIVDERRKYHERTGYKFIEPENDDDESIGIKKKFAALDLLLSLEKKGLIDESGIIEEINTFTVAAHDTATLTMTFTLLLLAENLDFQAKARKEAVEVIDRCGGVLTTDGIKDLEYIERCMKETMRIFPPGHTIGRSITKDLPLKNHILPAGSDAMLMIFDLHRDPRFWKDPLKFEPDRFSPEQVENHYPYTYLPFSAGPRNCLGQKLAVMTVKALVAYMLYNYKLEPVTKSDEVEFKLAIILSPSEPIYIRTIKL